MSKFCCEGFKNLYENKNNKGVSIELKVDKAILVYRSVNLKEEPKLIDAFRDSFIGNDDLPSFGISGSISISHCPSCGKKISHFYQKNRKFPVL